MAHTETLKQGFFSRLASYHLCTFSFHTLPTVVNVLCFVTFKSDIPKNQFATHQPPTNKVFATFDFQTMISIVEQKQCS